MRSMSLREVFSDVLSDVTKCDEDVLNVQVYSDGVKTDVQMLGRSREAGQYR